MELIVYQLKGNYKNIKENIKFNNLCLYNSENSINFRNRLNKDKNYDKKWKWINIEHQKP